MSHKKTYGTNVSYNEQRWLTGTQKQPQGAPWNTISYSEIEWVAINQIELKQAATNHIKLEVYMICC